MNNKTILLTVVTLFITTRIMKEQKIEMPNTNYFPEFVKAYEKIRKWEGNYAFLEFDKGGETYAGIARNANEDWIGWEVLDEHKRDSSVYWNKKIEELEHYVISYYYNVWVRDGFYKIEDPFIRDYVFDYRNTGPIAYRHVKEVLVEMGYDVGNRATLDKKTIDALNKVNSIIFIERLVETRKSYYERVVGRNPDLKIYLKGWVKRANDIV